MGLILLVYFGPSLYLSTFSHLDHFSKNFFHAFPRIEFGVAKYFNLKLIFNYRDKILVNLYAQSI